jgi:hypothetical protein
MTKLYTEKGLLAASAFIKYFRRQSRGKIVWDIWLYFADNMVADVKIHVI